MKRILLLLFFALFCGPAFAACPSYPYALSNGTTADANQVMANFNTVLNCVNGGPPVALTFGSTITPNFTSGNFFTVTLTGNATLANPSNLGAGQCGVLFITQDSTGSRTLTYGTAWKFPGGTAPVLTTAPGATDELSFCSWAAGLIAAQLTANFH
jgi:hypothetical protein